MSSGPSLNLLGSTSRRTALASGSSLSVLARRSYGLGDMASPDRALLLQRHGSARLPPSSLLPSLGLRPPLPRVQFPTSTIHFASLTPTTLSRQLAHYTHLVSPEVRPNYSLQDQHTQATILRILRHGVSLGPKVAHPGLEEEEGVEAKLTEEQLRYFQAAQTSLLTEHDLSVTRREKAMRDIKRGMYDEEDGLPYEEWRKMRLESVERRREKLRGDGGLEEGERRKKERRLEGKHQERLRCGEERRKVRREMMEEERRKSEETKGELQGEEAEIS